MPKIAELIRLAEDIKACKRCELAKTRKFAFPGEGSAESRVMFIGAAPGPSSDEGSTSALEHSFIGGARSPFHQSTITGRILMQSLSFIGLAREDVYLTNLVKCPVKGRRPHDPQDNEIKECFPWLEDEIEILKPKLIVSLGAITPRYLVRERVKYGESMTLNTYHGKQAPEIRVFPMPHPMSLQGYGHDPEKMSEKAREILARLMDELKQINS